MPKETKPDFNQTAKNLMQRDKLLKFGLFATVIGGVVARRPATVMAALTGYGFAERKRVHQEHQNALEANRLSDGSLPEDPYPGFFTSDDRARFKEATDMVKEVYDESGLDEVIRSMWKK